MPAPPRRRPAPASSQPHIRRGTVRIPADVARRILSGHPYVFREALGGRPLREKAGQLLDVVDVAGNFVARGIYDPDGPVAVRVFSRDQGEAFDADAFGRRVETAKRLREALLPREGLTVCRAIHGEGDGIPAVTVDRYGDHLVVHLYSVAMLPHRELLYDALQASYSPVAIYEQHRFRPLAGEGPRGPATLARGAVAPIELQVLEAGLRFFVDVTAPLGTGLFPDLREGRAVVAAHARGRRVLNLFSYTGAFSVYAVRAGAEQVVSVDLAPKAHARARRNFTANGLPEQPHEFVCGDTFKVLAKMADRGRQFDLVILDPPSFAQGHGRVFSAQKDYCELVEGVLAVAAPGALIACISNTHKLSLEDFDRAIGDAAGRSKRLLRVVDRRGLPPDFPVSAGFLEGHYLKFFLCAVK